MSDQPPQPRMRADLPPVDEQPRTMGRRGAILGSLIALVVLAGLGWWAWELTRPQETVASGPGGGRPGGPGAATGGGRGGRGGPATTVGIAVAESADIPIVLDALGTVTPRATVRVRPQVSGVLQEIHFNEGQSVRKGQLLAVIDPRPFEMAQQQAIAQRMRNEAQLEAARVTLGRFRTLLQQDSIARQEVDTQAAQVRQLEAALIADRAQEGTARLNLAYTRIVAPVEGRVGLRTVDVGNVVGPGDAQGIAVVTQLRPVDVEFAIPQDHASALQRNAGAFMEVRAFDRTRTELLDIGSFASLDNQIDTQTGTVRAKARFSNARLQLFPNQFVNVRLQVRVIPNAVVVPAAAVRQGSTGEYVFVLQEDRSVKLRLVTRGEALEDRVQVTSGLQAGERVVTEGADRLRDGARVMLPGDAPRPGGGGGGGRRQRGEGGPRGPTSAASAPEPLAGASAAQGPAAPAPKGAGPRATRP